jgi:LysR family transcriptional regulator, hypochlorite-specific transcription factor HypT
VLWCIHIIKIKGFLMDFRHFEDLRTLVEVRSFSQAAKLRGISTSSLTRRIHQLEQSFNIQLIDRSTYPTKLTPQGQAFYDKALELLIKIDELKECQTQKFDLIRFSMLPHLGIQFFPQWLYGLQTVLGTFATQVKTTSTHDGSVRLIEEDSDFWLTYHHPLFPNNLPKEYDYITLARESFAPYSCLDWNHQPMHVFSAICQKNNRQNQQVNDIIKSSTHQNDNQDNGIKAPFLQYHSQNYLYKITQAAMADKTFHLDFCLETNSVDVLHAMVMKGHGIAFLPFSAVKNDLANQQIVRADLFEKYEYELEIRLYRGVNHSPHTAHRISSIWRHLVQNLESIS